MKSQSTVGTVYEGSTHAVVLTASLSVLGHYPNPSLITGFVLDINDNKQHGPTKWKQLAD